MCDVLTCALLHAAVRDKAAESVITIADGYSANTTMPFGQSDTNQNERSEEIQREAQPVPIIE